MRDVLAVVAGVIAGVITVFLLEALGHMIFPPPDGLDVTDKEAMKTMMDQIPFGAKAAVLVAWFFGSLIGAITGLKLSQGKKLAGWIPVLILLALGISTLFMFPHPVWMIAGAIILPLLAGWLAQKRFANTQ